MNDKVSDLLVCLNSIFPAIFFRAAHEGIQKFQENKIMRERE